MSKLAYMQDSATAKRLALFVAFWVINSAATFMFGFEFLNRMYTNLLAFLPFADGSVLFISSMLGGMSALLVCDIAYLGWNGIALNSAHTIVQMTVARAMFLLSFLLSLAYTVITLGLLTFPHLLSLEQAYWMEAVGAISFTVMLAGHISATVFYVSQDPRVKQRKTETEMAAKAQAEQMAYQKKVAESALVIASRNAGAEAERIAEMLGQSWGDNLVAQMVKIGDAPLIAPVAHQQKQATKPLIVEMPTNAHQSQIPAPPAQTASTNNRQSRTVAADEGDDWQTALGGDVPVMAMAFDSAPEAVVLTTATAGDGAEGGDFFGHGR